MSLIGVFRCGDSAVLLADSQETHGTAVKTEVNKIDLFDDGHFRRKVAYAAATNAPALSSRLSAKIREWVTTSTVFGTERIREEIATVVAQFYASEEYNNYPADTHVAKWTEAVVCVATLPWPVRSVDVFRISGAVVAPIVDWHMSGVDYQFVNHIARRRYHPTMTVPEATLLGLYLFRCVERVSTSVGPPMRVAIVSPSGIYIQEQALTDLHSHHFANIVETLEEVVFAAPNLQEPDEEMSARWASTCNSMTALRGLFRQDVATHYQRLLDQLPPEQRRLLKLPE